MICRAALLLHVVRYGCLRWRFPSSQPCYNQTGNWTQFLLCNLFTRPDPDDKLGLHDVRGLFGLTQDARCLVISENTMLEWQRESYCSIGFVGCADCDKPPQHLS